MVQDDVVSNQTTVERRKRSRIFGNFIIKFRLQLKYSFIVLAFLSVACLALWYQGQWVFGRLIQAGAFTAEDATSQLHILNEIVMYASFLAIAIVFGLSVFFTHFVAGPIYRMEKTFEEMKDGDLSMDFRIRKHDELQDTALLFSEALSSIRSKLGKEREGVSLSFEKVGKAAELLRQAGREDEATQLDQIIFDHHNNPPQIKI